MAFRRLTPTPGFGLGTAWGLTPRGAALEGEDKQ